MELKHFEAEEDLTGARNKSVQSSTRLRKPENAFCQHLESKLSSLTPEKTSESFHVKGNKETVELPEKYRTLSELFNRMISSLRLLKLRKRSPTFQNISSQVKVLAGRNFSYMHLAQIKFIFPEAVQIKRILMYNEKTMCMVPELRTTLLFDAVEGHNEQSLYSVLCDIFSERLFSVSSQHPEGFEIPMSELPEPFNQSSVVSTDLLYVKSKESLPHAIEADLLSSSHLHSSFNRHFSRKAVVVRTEKTQILSSPFPLSSVMCDEMTEKHSRSGNQEVSPDTCSISTVVENSAPSISSPACVGAVARESTPVKFAVEAEKLSVETPAQSTPKRSMPTVDKLKMLSNQKMMPSNASAKRILDFSRSGGEERFLVSNSDFQTGEVKSMLEKEEESNCFISTDDFIISGRPKPRYQPDCLLDIVTTIHHIFQSTPCSSITKEELVHKILMNNLDVVESREVEDHLKLLEELVPYWITKKKAASGDILYVIANVPDLKSVCEKLR